jgi:hypothetical protein
MKKFFLYVFLALAILAAIFTYILYSEGAFDTQEPAKKSELKPFMKGRKMWFRKMWLRKTRNYRKK